MRDAPEQTSILFLRFFAVHLIRLFLKIVRNLSRELLHRVVGTLCPLAAFLGAAAKAFSSFCHAPLIRPDYCCSRRYVGISAGRLLTSPKYGKESHGRVSRLLPRP